MQPPMTTARNLLVITLDSAGDPPVRAGDLSLALAGAELIDLCAARVVELREDRIVPGRLPAPADVLLEQAFASFIREEPYETISDWLWRRGKALDVAYVAAFETEGLLTRQRRRARLFPTGEPVLVDSPARRQATERWSSAEPVLVTLAEAVGVRGPQARDLPPETDGAVELILAAVGDALQELDSERQRRSIEQEAFNNIWRAP
ncbi:GOLPH3/VPS74 family protein [Streptomyces lancefieldiae]|uniref:GPP34 family phosphoprotein n=1 Tax=Streptomyces lancefieldiae TaxID=3075520 RepID=A0ABU3ALL1_9ACTN|nr:GPP34 family phosphoprotein [Streptomyces sp. DSM 40712]MDT0611081.1 GPP34 family phosphoprotein [Streptomyces sp. DSM 40712]